MEKENEINCSIVDKCIIKITPLADLKNIYEGKGEEEIKKLGCFEACIFQKLDMVCYSSRSS